MKTYAQAVEMIADRLLRDDLDGVWCARADGSMVTMTAFVFEVNAAKVYADVGIAHDELRAKGVK